MAKGEKAEEEIAEDWIWMVKRDLWAGEWVCFKSLEKKQRGIAKTHTA